MNERKDLKKYREFLEKAAKSFKLTTLDISNLYDLSNMITWQDYEKVFKPNKINHWFSTFFDKLEEICLAEEEDYNKILIKLKK